MARLEYLEFPETLSFTSDSANKLELSKSRKKVSNFLMVMEIGNIKDLVRFFMIFSGCQNVTLSGIFTSIHRIRGTRLTVHFAFVKQ